MVNFFMSTVKLFGWMAISAQLFIVIHIQPSVPLAYFRILLLESQAYMSYKGML